jgi:hypothetical protein
LLRSEEVATNIDQDLDLVVSLLFVLQVLCHVEGLTLLGAVTNTGTLLTDFVLRLLKRFLFLEYWNILLIIIRGGAGVLSMTWFLTTDRAKSFQDSFEEASVDS